MAKRKRAKRSHMSYVRAGKKAARTRARKRKRKNPTRHRPVVYSTGRGKRKKLRRSPWYMLKPKRINPKRRRKASGRKRYIRRRRRNPAGIKGMARTYFGRNRLQNAIMLLVGMGGAAALKGVVTNMLPKGNGQDWASRMYGFASIVLGVTVQMKSRRKAVKSAGVGMVVFGLYDVIVSNTPLGAYLPSIGAPTFKLPNGNGAAVSGYSNFGQRTYANNAGMMGAGIGPGGIETVGSNIGGPGSPEIVGMEDMDLADALEMSC
ncbi:MAG: hypothetical protein GY862_05510 [Gammaproteobacteria bacterium]|nr:hypothetical protein [Gammaproteobacteria bacterium]